MTFKPHGQQQLPPKSELKSEKSIEIRRNPARIQIFRTNSGLQSAAASDAPKTSADLLGGYEIIPKMFLAREIHRICGSSHSTDCKAHYSGLSSRILLRARYKHWRNSSQNLSAKNFSLMICFTRFFFLPGKNTLDQAREGFLRVKKLTHIEKRVEGEKFCVQLHGAGTGRACLKKACNLAKVDPLQLSKKSRL